MHCKVMWQIAKSISNNQICTKFWSRRRLWEQLPLTTLLHLFCLEVHRKSSGSPAEVQWTEDLANITGFCLSPSEIQRKSSGSPAEVQRTQNSGQSNHFLILGGLSGLSLDFGWTSSGIQSCPTDFRRTVRWVRWKWQGPMKVHRSPLDKQWECKVLRKTKTLSGKKL